MRLVIAGTILVTALAVGSVSAQQQSPKAAIVGNKAFCLKGTEKVDCSFDTLAACQKGMKDASKDSTSGGSCVSRSEAR